MLKIKKSAAKDLLFGDTDDSMTIIDSGEWLADGKYQTIEVIVKDNDTQKLYKLSEYRSGSYHTDWYYGLDDGPDEISLPEVIGKTITKVIYEEVKNGK